MSEDRLVDILSRYEGRTDEFADLVRALVSSVRTARVDSDAWQTSYINMRDRLARVVAVAEGRAA